MTQPSSDHPAVDAPEMPPVRTSSSSSGPTSTSPVKRACDSCHRRKVKCIGGEGMKQCKNCTLASLTCTYNSVPQKKGPKGSRAKVLSELREHQRQSQLAPDSGYGYRSLSPGTAKTPGLLTTQLAEACVDYYLQNIYATQPILHAARMHHAIAYMDQAIESYCELSALSAYVLIQPHMVLPPTVALRNETGATSNIQLAYMLLEEAIRVRRNYDIVENPTLLSVYTSFFISQCYYCIDKQNAAWVFLREALTLAHILGMHEEASYKTGDLIENSRKRRLYWLLFITERAYAFKRHRPLTLYATIHMPSPDDDPNDAIILTGFRHLINLYRPFDETFFSLWNRTSDSAGPNWLVQLQKQLNDALPRYLEGSEIQTVDLRMSQQWLKIMVWQLAISHGYISSMATDSTLSFEYPIEISRELVELSNEFSQHAMEIHGIGLIEKLFDIACTLTDVMACVPPQNLAQANHYESAPQDYLNRFVHLISTLRGGQSRYLSLVVNKIQDVLPSHNLPLTISRNMQPTETSAQPLFHQSNGQPQPTAHYDSPPTPHDMPQPNLHIRPSLQHSSSSQFSPFTHQYDNTQGHVASSPTATYPVFQQSIAYSPIGQPIPTQQIQVTQEVVGAMYQAHVAQLGPTHRPSSYGVP